MYTIYMYTVLFLLLLLLSLLLLGASRRDGGTGGGDERREPSVALAGGRQPRLAGSQGGSATLSPRGR